VHRHQRSREVSTPDTRQPLRQILAWWDQQSAAAVYFELKAGFGVGQCQGSYRFVGCPGLAGSGAQKLSAGRRIEEERSNGDSGAGLPRQRRNALQTAAHDEELGSFALPIVGTQGQSRDRCDSGEGFAPESEGGHAHEIGGGANLAGGVAVECEDCILATHPAAVVADLDSDLSAIFQLHPDMASPRIEGILDQLLDHRSGPLDHLAGGDLVGHRIG
jgi:hypothetical protein